LAILDLRSESHTYGKTQMYDLSDQNPRSIYVPAGCVNGHLCLSERGLFFYKWSEVYNGAEKQVTVKWDDPDLNLPWKCRDPIVSDRDRLHGIPAEGVYL
jgi:dTDP-4-dehydrorhamnose 3,5-epimerase